MVPVVSIVMETIMGISTFFLINISFAARSADLICNTSWHVSMSKRSHPPSINPEI